MMAFDINFAKQIILNIKEALSAHQKKKLNIIWHGGEPLLWGIDNKIILICSSNIMFTLDFHWMATK